MLSTFVYFILKWRNALAVKCCEASYAVIGRLTQHKQPSIQSQDSRLSWAKQHQIAGYIFTQKIYVNPNLQKNIKIVLIRQQHCFIFLHTQNLNLNILLYIRIYTLWQCCVTANMSFGLFPFIYPYRCVIVMSVLYALLVLQEELDISNILSMECCFMIT